MRVAAAAAAAGPRGGEGTLGSDGQLNHPDVSAFFPILSPGTAVSQAQHESNHHQPNGGSSALGGTASAAASSRSKCTPAANMEVLPVAARVPSAHVELAGSRTAPNICGERRRLVGQCEAKSQSAAPEVESEFVVPARTCPEAMAGLKLTDGTVSPSNR